MKKIALITCAVFVMLLFVVGINESAVPAQAKSRTEMFGFSLAQQQTQIGAAPTPTPAPISPPKDAVELFRDDFDNPQYNGAFNQSNWWEVFWGDYDKAKAVQEDGVMKMKAEFSGKENEFYGLSYHFPALDIFEQAEVKVKASKFVGRFPYAYIVFYPDNASEGWRFGFGIYKNEKGEGEAFGFQRGSSKLKPYKPIAVDLNEWHTLTLRYDKKKTTFSFYVDNQLLGSINVANDLKNTAPDSSYAFWIGISGDVGDDGNVAEAEYDYAVIWAPQEKAASLPQPPTPLPTKAAAAIPIGEPSANSLGEMKVFTYNILYGGGEKVEGPKDIKAERLPKLLDYINKQKADVVALQELNGWQNGDPNLMEQIAKESGYNGYLALCPGGFHNGLLTKYPILETRNISEYLSTLCGMYARLDSPFGPLNIFNVHFDAFNFDKRMCQSKYLVKLAEPYRSELTLLLGDFNQNIPFQTEGYTRVASYGIDHIWASPAFKATRKTYVADKEAYDLSDHLPVGASLYINEKGPKSVESFPELTVEEQKPLKDVGNAAILSRYTEPKEIVLKMDDPCDRLLRFDLYNASFTDDGIKVIGKSDWASGAQLAKELKEKTAVMAKFSYKGSQEFNIFLDHGYWDTEPYRRFGVYVKNNTLSSDNYLGKKGLEGKQPFAITLKPEKSYDLLLSNDGDGRFSVALWESEDPNKVLLQLTTEQFDDSWKGLNWAFHVGANKGEILISKIIPFTFEGVKE